MTEAEKLIEEVARVIDPIAFAPVQFNMGMPWGTRKEFAIEKARAAISVTLSAVDSKLDDLLARYPSAVTEWSAAVREIRRSLFPRSPGD